MIVVYTKTGCPWCAEVLEFLRDKKIEFEEKEVLKNPKFMEELMQRSGQNKTPTLDVGGDILADTDIRAVENFLKNKGIIN
ncbi:MAG: glutaredoxin domain-containing protein [bacterium]|nr:glutaredoxin domain-containing protein [bacterium]